MAKKKGEGEGGGGGGGGIIIHLICQPSKRDATKPGLWTMDWTVGWTVDWAFLIEMSYLAIS